MPASLLTRQKANSRNSSLRGRGTCDQSLGGGGGGGGGGGEGVGLTSFFLELEKGKDDKIGRQF